MAAPIRKARYIGVGIVHSVSEAVEVLTKTDYALVLMDCLMPEMGGIEATKLIRSGTSGARNPDVPIVALTANAFQSNADACVLAGMNGYITKPVSVAALREAVQRWTAATVYDSASAAVCPGCPAG